MPCLAPASTLTSRNCAQCTQAVPSFKVPCLLSLCQAWTVQTSLPNAYLSLCPVPTSLSAQYPPLLSLCLHFFLNYPPSPAHVLQIQSLGGLGQSLSW